MDLGFLRFDRAARQVLPTDLAVLLVGMAARQAASPTARLAARLARTPAAAGLLAPQHGAFHPAWRHA